MQRQPSFKYSEIVDIRRLQELMDSLHKVTGISSSVIDTDGKVLAKSGWQKACITFHRTNLDTNKRCIESDTALAKNMMDGKRYALFTCLNGLTIAASPIIVDGIHVANVISSQSFTSPPDFDFFKAQAGEFGFDEKSYIAAISEIPIIPVEKIRTYTELYANLASLFADSGRDRLKEQLIAQEYQKLNSELEARVLERTKELSASESLLRNIIELTPVPNALLSADGKVTYVNQAFTKLFGYSNQEISTLDDWWVKAYPDPSYRSRMIDRWESRIKESSQQENPFGPSELLVSCKDDSQKTVIFESVLLTTDQPQAIRLVVFHDITALRQAEIEVRKAKERIEAAAAAGIVGFWEWDIPTNKLVWDKVMYKLYGIHEEDFAGAYEAWSAAVHPDDKAFVEAEIQAALYGLREYAPEFRVIWADQSVHYIKAGSRTIFDNQGNPLSMIGVNYDLTEQKKIQKQLDQLAYYDRLTKLPNRRLLEDRLDQAIALAHREDRKIALLFIDLDKFKPINDTYGHDRGDWLLQKVAKRILKCVRQSDTVARIGGDEFIVLLQDSKYIQDACMVAEKIRHSLNEPFVTDDGVELKISSSLGVAIYPDHARMAGDLIRFGDEAMYNAKKQGRNKVIRFETDASPGTIVLLNGEAVVRLYWSSSLSCSEPTIDREHESLINAANNFVDFIIQHESDRDKISESFCAILDEISRHFEHEEAILHAHQYGDWEEHTKIHQALFAKAKKIYLQWTEGSTPTSRLVKFLVSDVVANHIMREDRKYFRLFKSEFGV